MGEPNPNQEAFDKALATFHAADMACQDFRKQNVVALFAESDPVVAEAQELRGRAGNCSRTRVGSTRAQ